MRVEYNILYTWIVYSLYIRYSHFDVAVWFKYWICVYILFFCTTADKTYINIEILYIYITVCVCDLTNTYIECECLCFVTVDCTVYTDYTDLMAQEKRAQANARLSKYMKSARITLDVLWWLDQFTNKNHLKK